MAINIYSGSNSPGKQKNSVNKASNSDRVKASRQALASTGEVSTSGNTAVGTKGTLAKVGQTVGKVAGVVGKFIPGIGGTVANALSNLLNDPEWWQSVPGDALTLNEPLREIDELLHRYDAADSSKQYALRIAILEFLTASDLPGNYSKSSSGHIDGYMGGVFHPTQRMITQYLMPQVRKVVNAVPLQDAEDYDSALRANATLYAMWRQLKKIDYCCKHGQTYLANMNDPAFPLFRTENAAWLQATINRLEEYLRANVRLPHTLCEYLAWRFGRVYKSNDSKKSALVMYNFLPLAFGPEVWDRIISRFMNLIAQTPTVQRANTDLYNTYFDHDYMVEIRDDTQFTFDKKEFMLRLNLVGCGVEVIDSSSDADDAWSLNVSGIPALMAIDSNLDNPTAFMATSISAAGIEQDGTLETLFPVDASARVYIPNPRGNSQVATASFYTEQVIPVSDPSEDVPVGLPFLMFPSVYLAVNTPGGGNGKSTITRSSASEDPKGTIWLCGYIEMDHPRSDGTISGSNTAAIVKAVRSYILAKSVDLYNIHVNMPVYAVDTTKTPHDSSYAALATDYDTPDAYIDGTSLSIDAGSPTFTVINTEHVYAFANLVDIERKHSLSYKQAEHLVAKDTADLVDKLDVAAIKS